MSWVVQSPLAILIFNRPELTKAVFGRIAAARPARLLLVADGPRSDRPEEPRLCDAARKAILEHIDWPCDVSCNLAEENMGCRQRVSSGLDWVFEQVEEAIVLEDDCLPDPTLFRFFDEMLLRYRDDDRVMMISGFNSMRDGCWKADIQQYHFSFCATLWGWASWRRAWRYYDVNMKLLTVTGIRDRIRDVFADPERSTHWLALYEKVFRGEIDTWDYQWMFARAIQSGMSVVPSRNLVCNIGHGPNATHTTRWHPLAATPTMPMTFPLRFHDYVAVDRDFDRLC